MFSNIFHRVLGLSANFCWFLFYFIMFYFENSLLNFEGNTNIFYFTMGLK